MFLRKYRAHYTHFSFLPPFGILCPHRDRNLISARESILQHLPLQNTTRREGHSRKSSPQCQERRHHSRFLGKLAWDLWASPKLIFPGRFYVRSPQLQSCRLSALRRSSSPLFSAKGVSLWPRGNVTSQQLD